MATFMEINWWQVFISVIIPLILIGIPLIWNHYKEKGNERRKQYSNLLFILHELRYFIERYETYLDFKKDNCISFNTIAFGQGLNYMEPSHAFNLNPQVYIDVQKIYKIAQEIMYILEHSEAVTTTVKKKNNEEIHTQDNVLSGRYYRVVAFVEHYLLDSYNRFNSVFRQIKRLSDRYNYDFPRTLKPFSECYIDAKKEKYGLN